MYRKWYDQHFHVRRPLTWLRKEMAWQSVIISNCEDVVLYRFKDWPKLAADAKKYDVTTFEILGWNVGGIDRGYPQYTPDPRLGTPEEFRAGSGGNKTNWSPSSSLRQHSGCRYGPSPIQGTVTSIRGDGSMGA